MTITEFLLARIAEDEQIAREATAGTLAAPLVACEAEDRAGVTELLIDPARVLAECEAKRRVVQMGWHHFGEDDYAWGMEEAKRQILAVLALPYAGHPDYRDEWRS